MSNNFCYLFLLKHSLATCFSIVLVPNLNLSVSRCGLVSDRFPFDNFSATVYSLMSCSIALWFLVFYALVLCAFGFSVAFFRPFCVPMCGLCVAPHDSVELTLFGLHSRLIWLWRAFPAVYFLPGTILNQGVAPCNQNEQNPGTPSVNVQCSSKMAVPFSNREVLVVP